MKKLILGLDGMDFDVAVKLNLQNVLQLQFDRIAVPINEKFKQPSSPEVWASFLCGEHVNKVFKGRKRLWSLSYLEGLKKIFPFISLGIGKKVTGMITGFPELDKKSWVDLPNVAEINSPYYSYTNEFFELCRKLDRDKDLDAFQNEVLAIYEKDTQKIINEVSSEMESPRFDIIFAYIHFPDLFNHFWLQDLDVLYSLYRKVDDFVGKVLSIVEGVHVIIISDHGWDFNEEKHSDFGFISSSEFMNFPKDIIGLGKLMYEYAGAEK